MQPDTLIAFASWEERCERGVLHTLNTGNIRRVLVFFSEEFEAWTSDTLRHIEAQGEAKGCAVELVRIRHRSPSAWWRMVQGRTREFAGVSAGLVFDYSTCPRDVLWGVLSGLRTIPREWHTVYYPPDPDGYGAWLSADPDQPYLVYDHSGLADALRPTAVVVTSGYDVQRTAQLYNVFEPERMIVLLQVGDQFHNLEKNLGVHLEWLRGKKDDRLASREINAYGPDRGYGVLKETVQELERDYNVVLASLGPKPGSIAMYNVWTECPSAALVYVPSRQYNREYSHGMSEPVPD